MRACGRDQEEDSSSEGESNVHDEHPALQTIIGAHDYWMMHFCVMWMNSFLVKSGISEKWSTREIVLRHKLDVKLHCNVPFGAYCEVHVDPDITNTMELRTRRGICLGPMGNMQGSYKFLSFATG